MKYIKEDLEKMLREHLKNEAKLKEIKLKKEEYEERLKYAGTVNEETAEEIIEGMQLSGQAYDIIHSNTNKITDKTATVAMNYHREEQYINQEDRAYLERKISECEEETNRLEKIVKRVNNLLEQTTDIDINSIEELQTGWSESGAETDIIKYINKTIMPSIKHLNKEIQSIKEEEQDYEQNR